MQVFLGGHLGDLSLWQGNPNNLTFELALPDGNDPPVRHFLKHFVATVGAYGIDLNEQLPHYRLTVKPVGDFGVGWASWFRGACLEVKGFVFINCQFDILVAWQISSRKVCVYIREEPEQKIG